MAELTDLQQVLAQINEIKVSQEEMNSAQKAANLRLSSIEESQDTLNKVMFGDEKIRNTPVLDKIEGLDDRIDKLEKSWQRTIWILLGYGAASGGAIASIIQLVAG